MAALRLVRGCGVAMATATAPVVLAEGGAEAEGASGVSRMVRPADLPIYEEPQEVLDFEYHGRERTSLEENVGVVRKEVEGILESTRTVRERAVHIYETGKAHSTAVVDIFKDLHQSTATVDYLTDEENMMPRAGAITIGGLAGLIIGARRRGGLVKKVLYTSTGVITAASLCYPRQAYQLSQQMYGNVKDYANIGYNFVTGVKPQSKASAPRQFPQDTPTPTPAHQEATPTTTQEPEDSEVRISHLLLLDKFPGMIDSITQQSSDVMQFGFRLSHPDALEDNTPSPKVPEGFGSVGDVESDLSKDPGSLTKDPRYSDLSKDSGSLVNIFGVSDSSKTSDGLVKDSRGSTSVLEAGKDVLINLANVVEDKVAVDSVVNKDGGSIAEVIKETVTDVGEKVAVAVGEEFTVAVEKVSKVVDEKITDVAEEIGSDIGEEVAQVAGEKIGEVVGKKVSDVVEKVGESVMEEVVHKVAEEVAVVVEKKVAEEVVKVSEEVSEVAGEVAEVAQVVEQVSEKVESVLNVVEEVAKAADDTLGVPEAVTEKVKEVVEVADEVADTVTAAAKQVEGVAEEVKQQAERMKRQAEEVKQSKEKQEEIFEDAVEYFTSGLKDTAELQDAETELSVSPESSRSTQHSEVQPTKIQELKSEVSTPESCSEEQMQTEATEIQEMRDDAVKETQVTEKSIETVKEARVEKEGLVNKLIHFFSKDKPSVHSELASEPVESFSIPIAETVREVQSLEEASTNKEKTDNEESTGSIIEVLEPVIVDVGEDLLEEAAKVVKEVASEMKESVLDVIKGMDVVEAVGEKVVSVMDDIQEATSNAMQDEGVTECVSSQAGLVKMVSEEVEKVAEGVVFVADKIEDMAELVKEVITDIEEKAAELIGNEDKREEFVENFIDLVTKDEMTLDVTTEGKKLSNVPVEQEEATSVDPGSQDFKKLEEESLITLESTTSRTASEEKAPSEYQPKPVLKLGLFDKLVLMFSKNEENKEEVKVEGISEFEGGEESPREVTAQGMEEGSVAETCTKTPTQIDTSLESTPITDTGVEAIPVEVIPEVAPKETLNAKVKGEVTGVVTQETEVKEVPSADITEPIVDILESSVEILDPSVKTPEPNVETTEPTVETSEFTIEIPKATVETPEPTVKTTDPGVETKETTVGIIKPAVETSIDSKFLPERKEGLIDKLVSLFSRKDDEQVEGRVTLPPKSDISTKVTKEAEYPVEILQVPVEISNSIQIPEPGIETPKSAVETTKLAVETSEPAIEITEPNVVTTEPTISTKSQPLEKEGFTDKLVSLFTKDKKPSHVCLPEAQESTVETSKSVVQTPESTIEIPGTTIKTSEPIVEIPEHTIKTIEPTFEIPEPTVETQEPTVETSEPTVEIIEPSVEATEPNVELKERIVDSKSQPTEKEGLLDKLVSLFSKDEKNASEGTSDPELVKSDLDPQVEPLEVTSAQVKGDTSEEVKEADEIKESAEKMKESQTEKEVPMGKLVNLLSKDEDKEEDARDTPAPFVLESVKQNLDITAQEETATESSVNVAPLTQVEVSEEKRGLFDKLVSLLSLEGKEEQKEEVGEKAEVVSQGKKFQEEETRVISTPEEQPATPEKPSMIHQFMEGFKEDKAQEEKGVDEAPADSTSPAAAKQEDYLTRAAVKQEGKDVIVHLEGDSKVQKDYGQSNPEDSDMYTTRG